MAGEGTLLDRLRAADVDRRELDKDVERHSQSIARSLERVLNCWTGQTLVEPELGLPDDAFRGSQVALIASRVAGMIERNVKSYEPRLQGARVTPMDSDPSEVDGWRFELTGRLGPDYGRSRVGFTVIRGKRQYRVIF